ncbi:hypothetical protein F3Y22_tig00111330pilonHSYRG00640 [Hibiscus syriacus]|uniref:Uncharacterized protein n=1 Tax=Hibiscus syriacus TaxID=106335 RepID=A0A6A2YPV8_HIBSY|nr:hypothetical protein F3Y22_tig00111330pilonHSYRG00640 [Hibiscus syriacus]
MHTPRESHLATAKRILKYLTGTLNYGLTFSCTGASFDVVAFADADWGSSLDYRWFVFGHAVFLADIAAKVTWMSSLLCDLGVEHRNFPRIHGMAIRKNCKISDFGSWVDGLWIWKIELRLELFSWEIPIWNNFNQVLNRGVPAIPRLDSLKWLGASNGKYNPKVAAFVWKAMYNRLPVVSELIKRGLNGCVQPLCPFCKLHLEDVGLWAKYLWPFLVPHVLDFVRTPGSIFSGRYY